MSALAPDVVTKVGVRPPAYRKGAAFCICVLVRYCPVQLEGDVLGVIPVAAGE